MNNFKSTYEGNLITLYSDDNTHEVLSKNQISETGSKQVHFYYQSCISESACVISIENKYSREINYGREN